MTFGGVEPHNPHIMVIICLLSFSIFSFLFAVKTNFSAFSRYFLGDGLLLTSHALSVAKVEDGCNCRQLPQVSETRCKSFMH